MTTGAYWYCWGSGVQLDRKTTVVNTQILTAGVEGTYWFSFRTEGSWRVGFRTEGSCRVGFRTDGTYRVETEGAYGVGFRTEVKLGLEQRDLIGLSVEQGRL